MMNIESLITLLIALKPAVQFLKRIFVKQFEIFYSPDKYWKIIK
jgi:hypothetical protein